MTLTLAPISCDAAKRYVAANHRHNGAPQGWKFGVAVEHDGKLVCVAMAGRPVGRGMDDGKTLEVTRVCSDGTRNANSKAYGAIARAAQALGYTRLITYTLQEESGASLRAAGFALDAELEARETWNCKARTRQQTDLFGNDRRPKGPKYRWVRMLGLEQR